jgi:mRNA interferase MazF
MQMSGRSTDRIRRDDIRWADLDPTLGREKRGTRPFLILSHEVFNDRSGTVIAVALTSQSQRAGFPLTLELPDLGLPKRSWIKISQVRTLSVHRIGDRIARAPENVLTRVVVGLVDLIGTSDVLV